MPAPSPPARPQPAAPRGLTARRLIRAVLLGLGGFVLLHTSPSWLLAWQGISLQGKADAAATETSGVAAPVPRDRRLNEADLKKLEGQDAVQTEGLTTHEDCRRRFPGDTMALARLGCQDQVTRNKAFGPIPQAVALGSITSAECAARMNAYWGARVQDLQERGDTRAASVLQQRTWMREVQACESHDNVRIASEIHQPNARLDALLARLDAGGRATEEDLKVLREDIGRVSAWPREPDRTPYLTRSERALRLIAGHEAPRPDRLQLNLDCAEIAELHRQHLREEERDVRAQQALRQGDRVTDGRLDAALNQRRIDRLWTFHTLQQGARQAGCPLPLPGAAATAPGQSAASAPPK